MAGKPIAYALDGYPVEGETEPDGSPLEPLDDLGGHEHGQVGYHYHAMKQYPHLIGGFRGEVVERDGQVDPQPRADRSSGDRRHEPGPRGGHPHLLLRTEAPAVNRSAWIGWPMALRQASVERGGS